MFMFVLNSLKASTSCAFYVTAAFIYLFIYLFIFLQVAIQPLRDGTDLRDNVQVAMAAFKENCGLAPISNIKQCLRMLVSRISSSCDNASLQISMKGDVSNITIA